jgi:uridine kinase
METISVSLEDGRSLQCPVGTRVDSLVLQRESPAGLPWIAALVNNDTVSLTYPLPVNSSVRFIAMDDPHGWRIYRRSVAFLLAKAVRDLFPGARFSLEHSFGGGLFCGFSTESEPGITRSQLRALEARMRDIVARNEPIIRRKVSYADAVRRLADLNQNDRLGVLKFRNPPHVVLNMCGDYSDIAHGPLAPSTGVLNRFQLVPYPPGFVLHLPDREKPQVLTPFEDQPHLFRIFQEHKEWGRIMGVTTVGRLNEVVANDELGDVVRIAESLHEKKIAQIADRIAGSARRVRVVLIAGPSSAGKTTFAKRLVTQLRVNGLRPETLSTDDYFVAPDRNPRDAAGNLDYEHVEAIDLALFNEHVSRLCEGAQIQTPRFNFETKSREPGRALRLTDDQILVIEGIHGLNPRLTERLPADSKFRIYVSALTQLSVDSGNRISTTDNRLMRRLVRDRKYRGHTALGTLRLWPSVRSGEKRWVFPFQREADATFNSALDYELAVLKPMVEPLLAEVKPTDPEYAEARRLSEFLLNFLPAQAREVPPTSILREYIGGSAFRY